MTEGGDSPFIKSQLKGGLWSPLPLACLGFHAVASQESIITLCFPNHLELEMCPSHRLRGQCGLMSMQLSSPEKTSKQTE